jgi:hypothetical protein
VRTDAQSAGPMPKAPHAPRACGAGMARTGTVQHFLDRLRGRRPRKPTPALLAPCSSQSPDGGAG